MAKPDSTSPEPGGLFIQNISKSPAVTKRISALLQQDEERFAGYGQLRKRQRMARRHCFNWEGKSADGTNKGEF